MPATMPAKTPEVFDYLKQCALEMRTATYGEIAQAVKRSIPFFNQELDYIRDEICIPQGLPWLSALAVNTKTRMPGDPLV